MHVLAIYSVNEHLADLMAEASAERQVNGRGLQAEARRFSLVTSRFAGRARRVAGPRRPSQALTQVLAPSDNSAVGSFPPGCFHRVTDSSPDPAHLTRDARLSSRGTGVLVSGV